MHDDDHEGSALIRDLKFMVDRRQILRWIAASSIVPFIGCATKHSSDSDAGTTSGSCTQVPEETGGPYPGDGSNGPNALSLSGIIRSDITSSIGDASGVAEGVPLTVKMKLVDAGGCAVLPGHAVYMWHCTRDGSYSMYTGSAQAENYLRGVQEVGDDGVVTFKTIFPGCYSGRWPHIHFEVYESLDAATAGTTKVATSQLAMPKDTCDKVYTSDGYSTSVTNLTQTSLQRDMVFSDGATLEIPTLAGDNDAGYTAEITIAVKA